MTKRYRLDVGSIIDNVEGRILSEVQVRNRLNKLHEENRELQIANHTLYNENNKIWHTIKSMMESERTDIGRNTLKQLWEAIQ